MSEKTPPRRTAEPFGLPSPCKGRGRGWGYFQEGASWIRPYLPATPGTYALVFRLSQPHTLTAGRLGAFDLSPGCYVYVGSARGPGGLRARVARHLRTEKRPHWHIDALTAIAPVAGVWWTVSPVRMECEWARALAGLPGVTIPIPRFGASDCGCPGHLLGI